MKRWLAAALFFPPFMAFAGCHTSTGTGTTTGPGDDASSTTCPCIIPREAGQNVAIKCGTVGCVDGYEVLCSDGIASTMGACLPPTTDACTPLCPTNACAVDDGCGGVCGCPSGEKCVFRSCSTNGCLRGPLDYCGLNPEAGASDCCASGLQCNAPDAAMASQCCIQTNTVQCSSSDECCGFPAVSCTVQYNDAGHPSGSLCQ